MSLYNPRTDSRVGVQSTSNLGGAFPQPKSNWLLWAAISFAFAVILIATNGDLL